MLILKMRLSTNFIVPSFLISLSLLIINNTPAGELLPILDYSEFCFMILRILWAMLHGPITDLPTPIMRQDPKTLYRVPIPEFFKDVWD
jgi:hypothetical protein